MGLQCKACGSEEHVKNGFMRGKQHFRCKVCGLNFHWLGQRAAIEAGRFLIDVGTESRLLRAL